MPCGHSGTAPNAGFCHWHQTSQRIPKSSSAKGTPFHSMPESSGLPTLPQGHSKRGKKGNLVSASSQKGVEVAYGVPWSPEGFISEARRRGHPAHIFEGLASGMKRAIVHNAKLKQDEIVRKRAAWFRKWTDRAIALMDEERKNFMPRFLRIGVSSCRGRGSWP